MRRLVIGLFMVSGFVWADAVWACNRGGSATNARRPIPNYVTPRYGTGFNYRSPPPPYYSRIPNRYYPNQYPGGYFPNQNYPNQYPGNPYLTDDGYNGYGTLPTVPASSSSATEAASPRSPAALLAPPLPRQPDVVPQTVGTNRMRCVAIAVRDLASASAASRVEQELGKLPGVRGVNVKPGDYAAIKVWFSESEPVALDDVIGEVSKLGLSAIAGE